MRNERVTITVGEGQIDLLADLSRFSKRGKAARIRDLAVIGLILSKGGAVAAVAAPTISPSKPDERPAPAKEPAEDARAARQKKLPAAWRGGSMPVVEK